MAPPGGELLRASNDCVDGKDNPPWEGENFSSWKNSFLRAASTHGWIQYFLDPTFEDPRVMNQTMTCLPSAMEYEAMKNPTFVPKDMNENDLAAWHLNEKARIDTIKLQKFHAMHTLYTTEFRTQARSFLLTALTPSLQLEMDQYDTPYRMYMALLNRYDTMNAYDMFGQLVDSTCLPNADVHVHCERIELLMSNLRSIVLPTTWSKLSIQEYDSLVWGSFQRLFLQHSMRTSTIDKINISPQGLDSVSYSEYKKSLTNIFDTQTHMSKSSCAAIEVPMEIVPEVDEAATLTTQSVSDTSKASGSNDLQDITLAQVKTDSTELGGDGNGSLTVVASLARTVVSKLPADECKNQENSTKDEVNTIPLPTNENNEPLKNEIESERPKALPPMKKFKELVARESQSKKNKPPLDEWSIPKKPKQNYQKPVQKPKEDTTTNQEIDEIKPEVLLNEAKQLPLTRRLSTSNLQCDSMAMNPIRQVSPSLPSGPTLLGRRASTSSMPEGYTSNLTDGATTSNGPAMKRRRKEEKASRWAPKQPAAPNLVTSGSNRLEAPVNDLAEDLSTIPLADASSIISHAIYVSQLTHIITEVTLETLCAPFGIQMDSSTNHPRIDVFMCQRTRRPRGDAVVYFKTPEGATRAVDELHNKQVKKVTLAARMLDETTLKILQRQITDRKLFWTCTGCRLQMSMWRSRCGSCSKPRVYPPSRVNISPTDWLYV